MESYKNQSLIEGCFSHEDLDKLPSDHDWLSLFSLHQIDQTIDYKSGWDNARYPVEPPDVQLGLLANKSIEPLKTEWDFTFESTCAVRTHIQTLEHNSLKIFTAEQILRKIVGESHSIIRLNEIRLSDEQAHLRRMENILQGLKRQTRSRRQRDISLASFTLEIITKRVEIRERAIDQEKFRLDSAVRALRTLRPSYRIEISALQEADRRLFLAEQRWRLGKPQRAPPLPTEIWYRILDEIIVPTSYRIRVRDKSYDWRLQRWMISKALYDMAKKIFYNKFHFNIDPSSFIGHPMANTMTNITIDFEDSRDRLPECFCPMEVTSVLNQLENCINLRNLEFMIGDYDSRYFVQEAFTKHPTFHPPTKLSHMRFGHRFSYRPTCLKCDMLWAFRGFYWTLHVNTIRNYILNGCFEAADLEKMGISMRL